jgi:hypothetical protein
MSTITTTLHDKCIRTLRYTNSKESERNLRKRLGPSGCNSLSNQMELRHWVSQLPLHTLHHSPDGRGEDDLVTSTIHGRRHLTCHILNAHTNTEDTTYREYSVPTHSKRSSIEQLRDRDPYCHGSFLSFRNVETTTTSHH